MKKIIWALTLLIGFSSAVHAESVYRFAVLEAMIQSHKSLSDRLKKRGDIDASVFVGTEITTNNSEDYQDIVVTMQKRIEGSFASVQFASELAALTTMATKTARMSSDAVDMALDNIGENPYVVPATTYVMRRSGQCINAIYKLVSMVATAGTGVVLATNEDRTQFCFMIRSKLLEIQNLMSSLINFCSCNTIFGNTQGTDYENVKRILQGSKDEDAMKMAGRLIDRAASGL